MTRIQKSTFVLAVVDVERTRRYFVEILGFVEDVRVGGWSFLSRGECHIRLGDCPGIKPISEAEDHSWFCYLHVDDARALYEEILRKGGELWHKIADKPWGMREFGIVTPDGHRIVFGQQL